MKGIGVIIEQIKDRFRARNSFSKYETKAKYIKNIKREIPWINIAWLSIVAPYY